MSERVRRSVKPWLALLLCSVAMAGCTEKTNADQPYYDEYSYSAPATPNASPSPVAPELYPEGVAFNGLKACFTKPPTEPVKSETTKWDSYIELTPDPNTGSVVGNPGPLAPNVEKKVQGALVEIEDDNGRGSGFLVAPDIAVTAAHVPDSINGTVTDSKGRVAHIKGGCYIHQDKGKPANLQGETAVSLDIAVLRLDRKIGSSTLKIASAPAERGSWVTFVNAQGAFTPQHPAVYNGLALTSDTDKEGASVLAGIDPRGSDDLESYIADGGCSGGPLVNRQGDVVAMSYASVTAPWDDKVRQNIEHSLPLNYGAILPEGVSQSSWNWYADPTRIITTPFINLALSSQNY